MSIARSNPASGKASDFGLTAGYRRMLCRSSDFCSLAVKRRSSDTSKPRRLGFSFPLILCLIAVFAREGLAGRPLSISGRTMGTTYRITIDGTRQDNIPVDLIESRLAEINSRMSTYDPDSEVTRFNRAAANDWFPVSAETAALVVRAKQISARTDGAFDITIGPVLRLWNFGAGTSGKSFSPPTSAAINAALKLVGYEKLEVRQSPSALRKTVEGLEIDLSAIAKGYAVDEVMAILKEQGITAAMVEIGGEMRVAGTKSDGSAWRVGVEAPIQDRRAMHSVIQPQEAGIASSGNYRNFQQADGKTYSHTIDPRSGQPVQHLPSSVTVVCDDCALADAYATALAVMGMTDGLDWANTNGGLALYIEGDEESGFNVSKSDSWNIPLEINPEFSTPQKAAESESKNMVSIFLIFGAATAVFGIALVGMAIGVIVSNRRIKGSCGGMAGMKDEHGNTLCEGCTIPSPECRGENLNQA